MAASAAGRSPADKRWGAECQAICRFVRGIMRQIGAKSKMDFRTYTADFSDPEIPLNERQANRAAVRSRLSLVDDEVQVLRTYWEPVKDSSGIPLDIRQNSGPWPGWNHFEAYLKVTPDDGGEVRLFGGGVGILKKKRNPLHVFYAIVELKARTRTIQASRRQQGRAVRLACGTHAPLPRQGKDNWTGPLP